MNTQEKFDVYQLVTDRIIEKLEADTVPWIHYLKAGGPNGYQQPRNLVTNKPYRGINVFLLGMSEFSSPYWLTFKQCQARGGQVRKGEHGTIIVFWKRLDQPEGEENEHEPAEHEHDRPHFVLRYYRVFNVQQCEGLTVPETEQSSSPIADDITPIEKAEEIAQAYLTKPNAPRFSEVGYTTTASYSPVFDVITMAAPKFFISPERYAKTKFHECVHSTGHSSRLNRKLEVAVGSRSEYSREELVAEMGASMLCALSGILEHTIENSTAYIQGWLSVLKTDKRAVVVAAGAAQKAADLIYGSETEEVSYPLAA